MNNKWEPIENVDVVRRKPSEWGKIYKMKLVGDIPDDIWSEYEWSYHIMRDLKYVLIPDKNGEFDKAMQMELRAMELKRDLFMGADEGEKHVLQSQYMETEWVRRRTIFI